MLGVQGLRGALLEDPLMSDSDGPPAKRILVVDDEPAMREAVASFLETRGYQVETAADAPSGLSIVRRGVDLVISDVRMPELDGIEFLQEIRPIQPNLPVILMTG